MVGKKSLLVYGNNVIHISKNLEDALQWFNQEKAKQIATGKLYRDPHFRAEQSSIVSTEPELLKQNYVWKRPSDIVDNPQCTVDGIDRFDVRQGVLGDCYFLAAVSCLCLREHLFNQVVPLGQGFDPEEGYCGMFLFRFWRYGWWVDMIVDDLLPTKNNKLVFMHSLDKNEFWSGLLEKAYAKLHGSYENIIGGSTPDVMVELTGGASELIDLTMGPPKHLHDIMLKANMRGSLMASCIEVDEEDVETKGPLGLIRGHAYSITCVRRLRLKNGSYAKLIRLRNPWGTGEFLGDWSDNSSKWHYVSDLDKRDITLTFNDDGEFWMSDNDFKSFFTKLELCHIGPDSCQQGDCEGTRWEASVNTGSWVSNSTAGGCRLYLDTFHMNPQFRVTIQESKVPQKEGNTMIVSLIQIPEPSKMTDNQSPTLHSIGYAIYKLNGTEGDAFLTSKFFATQKSVAMTQFMDAREVSHRHQLDPGTYVIIPSTHKPNEEARFMLRIFTEVAHDNTVIDDETAIQDLMPLVKETELLNPEDMEAVKSIFHKAARNGYIYANELRRILNHSFRKEFSFEGFSLETCRSLVACHCREMPGKLNYDEFWKLRCLICLWKTIFKQFDEDKSGSFSAAELRTALKHVGVRVSNKVFKRIGSRYASSDGEVTFDDFCLLVTRLTSVFETIDAQVELEDGRILVNKDLLIQQIINM